MIMNKIFVIVLFLLLLLPLFNGSLSNVFYSPQETRVLNDAASNAIKKDIWKEGHFQTGRKIMGSSIGSLMKGKKNYYYGSRERVSKEAEGRNLIVFSNKEKNVGGFVAFNADYKGPRHHPPKNN